MVECYFEEKVKTVLTIGVQLRLNRVIFPILNFFTIYCKLSSEFKRDYVELLYPYCNI